MTLPVSNVYIGDLPNDGTGDPLRTAFDKINENFAILETLQPTGPAGSFQFNSSGTPAGTANFAYNSGTNTINLGANVAIISNVTIGNTANPVSNLFVGNNSLRIGNITVTESGNVLSFPISVLPTNKASFLVNNLTGDGTIKGATLKTANSTLSTFSVTTTSNTANQIIWEAPATSLNSATFTVRSTEDESVNSQLGTLTVNKTVNGLDVNFTVSGTIFNGNVVTDYNVDYGYSNVRVMVSPFENTTITHQIDYKIVN